MEISLTSTFFVILITAAVSYYFWIKTYWRRRGVPSYGNIITGCFIDSFKAKENLAIGIEKFYSRVKHEKFVGTYLLGQPLLILNDPQLIKQVMQTEYQNFSSHGFFANSKLVPLAAHLFNLEGSHWKFMRSKMSPAFSSGKIKSMFNTVLKKVQHCENKMAAQESQTVVYNDYMRSLSIDIIFACFFGIEAGCLDNPVSDFKKMSFMLNTPIYGQFVNFLLFTHHHKLSHVLVRLKLIRFLPESVDLFLKRVMHELVQLRETYAEDRNDFLDLMIRLKNAANESNASETDKINVDAITAQLFVLFAAGFETTSQTNTFALFEMARQPELLKKAQEECDQVLKETGGIITYDALANMEYADKVIKETLRIYPALHFLTRSCIKPCKLPTTNVDLEKNTNVWIPLRGLHRDPQYFPNPHKFDPERFTKENEASIPSNVYMPFGDGPRTCIGMAKFKTKVELMGAYAQFLTMIHFTGLRFALMSVKTTMLTILSKYNIRLSEKTPKEITFEPLVYFPVPDVDCPLILEPRTDKIY